MGLDQLAEKENKQVVLLFDEFQQLLSVKNSSLIEGAICHVAQQTNASSYIFSGSNRHLLLKIFDDSSRPLFHLCDRIDLQRIPAGYYVDYLNKAAKNQWGKMLSQVAIDEVFELTKRHPYFLNSLCKLMWCETSPPVDAATVKEFFDRLCEQGRPRVSYDLASLSANQRAVIITITNNKMMSTKSMDFIAKSRVPLSSIAQAMNVLQEKDFIYKNNDGKYCITDPVMDYLLQEK